MENKKYKICVTFWRSNEKSSLWSNGVNQNAIYLVQLFRHMGNEAFLLYFEKKPIDLIGFPENIDLIDYSSFIKTKMDIVVEVGMGFTKKIWNQYKLLFPETKLVSYICGCEFNNEIEKIIYQDKIRDNKLDDVPNYDQIWIIPQMEKTSIELVKFKKRCKRATVVPFIWNPIVSEKTMKELKLNLYDGNPIKDIVIMEPNLNIQKNFLFPLLICAEFEKKSTSSTSSTFQSLNNIYLTNALQFKENHELKNILRYPYMEKVIIEGRFITIHFLNKIPSCVLSFQWEIPLNYLYFDVAWWGWPIVHNAQFCSDIGYYYPEWDLDMAVKQIDNVLKEHHTNFDYINNMRKIISRYTLTNNKLVENYSSLLVGLMNGDFYRWKYDYKTNTLFP